MDRRAREPHPDATSRTLFYSSIIQTLATCLSLFSTWNQRFLALVPFVLLAAACALIRLLKHVVGPRARVQVLIAVLASTTVSVSAGLLIFRYARSDVSPDLAIVLEAQTVSAERSPNTRVAYSDRWSGTSAAGPGDTLQWRISAVSASRIPGNIDWDVTFPGGVTPVKDGAMQASGQNSFALNLETLPTLEKPAYVRATVDRDIEGCPKTAFMSVVASTDGTVVGATTMPVSFLDPTQCKGIADNGSGGWGPSRQLWDWNHDKVGPTDGPVLNSYVNTITYGDERNHTAVRSERSDLWVDVLPVFAFGETLSFRVYAINDANEHVTPSLTAEQTRIRFYVPAGDSTGFNVGGYISSANATPPRVYDTATVVSDLPFRLEFIPGSARLFSAHLPKEGVTLPDTVVSETGAGALVGSKDVSGQLLPDFSNDIMVTIQVRVVKA